MLKSIVRIVVDTVIVATAIFVGAGTLAWTRAWVLLAVLMTVRLLSAIAIFRVNPALLRERATVLVHQGQPWRDKIILMTFMGTAFVAIPMIAARDVFRLQLLPRPPIIVTSLGLLLFAVGWIIIGIALRTNPFAVTVVRVQHERQHIVVDSGIYGRIRHPMYAGNPLVNIGLALWLGSYAAALFAIVPLSLLMLRITFEERFLRSELPGYNDYIVRVPYRLLPPLW